MDDVVASLLSGEWLEGGLAAWSHPERYELHRRRKIRQLHVVRQSDVAAKNREDREVQNSEEG